MRKGGKKVSFKKKKMTLEQAFFAFFSEGNN